MQSGASLCNKGPLQATGSREPARGLQAARGFTYPGGGEAAARPFATDLHVLEGQLQSSPAHHTSAANELRPGTVCSSPFATWQSHHSQARQKRSNRCNM